MVKLLPRKQGLMPSTARGLWGRAGPGVAEGEERVEGAAEVGESHRRAAGNPRGSLGLRHQETSVVCGPQTVWSLYLLLV